MQPVSKRRYTMSENNLKSRNQTHPAEVEDPLGSPEEVITPNIPSGVDRRTFLMRSAFIGATAVITGHPVSAQERANRSVGTPPKPALSPDLNVVKQQKGPVLTVIDEFYKVGPGPSSSHTIGPMRITYDFYQAVRNSQPHNSPRRQHSRFTCM